MRRISLARGTVTEKKISFNSRVVCSGAEGRLTYRSIHRAEPEEAPAERTLPPNLSSQKSSRKLDTQSIEDAESDTRRRSVPSPFRRDA
jgi:hypothetical protein